MEILEKLFARAGNQSLFPVLKNSMQIGLLHSAHNKPITTMNYFFLLALKITVYVLWGFDDFILSLRLTTCHCLFEVGKVRSDNFLDCVDKWRV